MTSLSTFTSTGANHVWRDGEIAMGVSLVLALVVVIVVLRKLFRELRSRRPPVIERTPEMSTLAFPPSTTRGRFE